MSRAPCHEMDILREAGMQYGIDLSPQQLATFRRYLDELWDWNRRMNLTGLTLRERIVIELFLDSLVPVPFLPDRGSLLDVGSGAGLPGLPFKICKPELKVHLLEPNAKRVSFLKHVIGLLGMEEIEVIRGRIERDRSLLTPEGYDVVTARALAGLDQIIAWCGPVLRPGGQLIGFLGQQGEGELERHRNGFLKQDLEPVRTKTYLLPRKDSKRTVVILRKRG
ncbi:MAG: 16S rRNA (guanine(527)-N(7))-methyltransferase RsmG [Desulfatiglandales bacterium]